MSSIIFIIRNENEEKSAAGENINTSAMASKENKMEKANMASAYNGEIIMKNGDALRCRDSGVA
jgi:hypothetical protein